MEITEKKVEPMLIAGIRIRVKHDEYGRLFSKLGRKAGRHIAGSAFNLYYDEEYKEENADFESCFPIKKSIEVEGLMSGSFPADVV